jgi:hypothetical protein
MIQYAASYGKENSAILAAGSWMFYSDHDLFLK